MKTTHLKPLFHEKTLNRAMKAFAFPADLEARREVIRPWIQTLRSGTLDIIKEVSLHGEFLKSVFDKILGYTNVIEGEGKSWTLHAETTISHGGGSADGAIGFFSATEGVRGGVRLKGRIVAPIELKGAGNDLDRPAPGRKESAVDQGWGYANYSEDCRWVIVSNYREIRLYRTNKTPAFAERFLLDDLARPEVFERFFFILCARNFLPAESDPHGQSAVERLLRDSDAAEIAITKDLYDEYKHARFALVEYLRTSGPRDVDPGAFVECAQKVLDRVLFVAFCEDRGLLPRDTLLTAHDHKDPYAPTSVWTRLKAVFRWVDTGRDDPPIPGYNGGLFKPDPLVDERIDIPDALCSQLVRLARYDFDTDVSVDVLGHIFEQSVSDLEELKAASAGKAFDVKKGRRKTQGVYYTPAWVTRHITKLALGGYLERRAEELRLRFGLDAIPEIHYRKLAKAERQFWLAYRDEVLRRTRVLDPACGSGAFLVAAFDFLLAEYERVNVALAFMAEGKDVLAGQTGFEDLNKDILTNNLFGVDLSSESVEITKLSLWLKTAERNRTLTFLDDNIRHGNSIIDDPALDPAAFPWRERFAAVFEDGGFDVVLGNPPYVRQELLTPFKPYLQEHYLAYDGTADIYTYFYELGVKALRPGGILSFIVTNKWLRSGYGEALRAFFAGHTVFEQIIDFGHAPIFEDADVFPCIVSVRKPEQPEAGKASAVRVCAVPRESLGDLNLEQYVAQSGYEVPWARFGKESWSLEPPEVDALMEKIRRVGVPLSEYAGAEPYVGLKTGYNEGYLLNSIQKQELVSKHPEARLLFRPYLRGQDIRRWFADWQGMWMILLSSSANTKWPWSDVDTKEQAEMFFRDAFPSVYQFMKQKEDGLANRTDQGRFWWELRSCAYLENLLLPKFIWQDLSFHSRFCLDTTGMVPEMTCFFLNAKDPWLLAVMNSPLMWCYLWRNTIHGKDEVLRLKRLYMRQAPVAPLNSSCQSEVQDAVGIIIQSSEKNQSAQHVIAAWLKTEMGIDKPGEVLSDAAAVNVDEFTAQVRKRRPKSAGKLGVGDVKAVQQAWNDIVPAMRDRNAIAEKLEARLSDLVNQAYGLTPEEIDLMWRTAPPRMPGKKPIKKEMAT
jgi:hypothetical protein